MICLHTSHAPTEIQELENSLMREMIFLTILLTVISLSICESSAQLPINQDLLYSGVWADESRSSGTTCSESDTIIDIFIWAWVPQDAGLNYITLRMIYPPGIFEGSRPEFNEFFSELIIVDYGSGGKEWTLLFNQCPSQWVLLFRQAVTVSGTGEISISITGEHSLARDCDFVLQNMNVLNNMSINGPSCDVVSTDQATWGTIKRLLD
jgi:hypothetical protein